MSQNFIRFERVHSVELLETFEAQVPIDLEDPVSMRYYEVFTHDLYNAYCGIRRNLTIDFLAELDELMDPVLLLVFISLVLIEFPLD